MVLAGPTDITAFVLGFVWLELHLLTFEVSDVQFRSMFVASMCTRARPD
jgi:hypothetical protein